MSATHDIVSCQPCHVDVELDSSPINEDGVSCPVCWHKLIWREGAGVRLADRVSLTTGVRHERARIVHIARNDDPGETP